MRIDGETNARPVGTWAFRGVPFVLSLAFLTRLWDTDLWWHLATGRFIVTEGRIPATDPFSYTALGRPWIYVTWGADLLLYFVEHRWGPVGLGVFKVVIVGTMLAALCAGCRAADASRGSTAAAVMATTVLVQWRYALLRPATLGAALLAVACAILLAWWHEPRRRWLAAFVVVTCAWTTVHATAILSPALAMVTLVATLANARRRSRIPDLLVTSLALGAVFWLLPSGRGVVASTHAHLANPDLTIYISEWVPGDRASPRFWLPLVGGFVSMALLRKELIAAPLPAGFWALGVALTARGVRNQYEAIVLGVPLIALGVDAAVARLEVAGLALAAKSVFLVWPLGTFAALLLVEPGPLLATWWGFGVRTEATPSDCVETLRRLPAGRVLNDLDTGGYLVWSRIPVFADGRALLVYDREVFERWFIPGFSSPRGMLAAADAFGVTYGLALHRKSLGQMMMASPDWVPAFHGMECSLFVYRRAAPSFVQAGHPLLEEVRGVYNPAWMHRFYQAVLSTPQGRRKLDDALAHVHRESPSTPVLPLVENTVGVLLGENAEAATKANAPAR